MHFSRISRQLSLTANPRASDSLLPDDMPQAFMGGRAIKNLEVFGASLLSNSEFPFLPERWSSLETICLPCAYLSGAWWYYICKEARLKLKRVELSIASRYDGGDDDGKGGDADKPSYYNETFLLCADTLEHLRIGSPGLVSSLPYLTSITRLRYLEASVTYIFPTPDAMRAAADICDHLPFSLKSTHLVDDLCDELDGVRDGIISRPGLCTFDPRTLSGKPFDCNGVASTFSKIATEVAHASYTGPKGPNGEFRWYGFSKDVSLHANGTTGPAIVVCPEASTNRSCSPPAFHMSDL